MSVNAQQDSTFTPARGAGHPLLAPQLTISELYPNRSHAPEKGCDCHDQLCSDTQCACFSAGEECTIRCFCSGFNESLSELKWWEHADDSDDWEDPDKKNWKHVCGNKYNNFEGLYPEVMEAVNVYENHSQCFEIFLEKERHLLESFKIDQNISHIAGSVFSLTVKLPLDASNVESSHIMKSGDIEILAAIATIPRSMPSWQLDPVLRSVKRSFGRSKAFSEKRLELVLKMVQRAITDDIVSFCFCDRKWVIQAETRNFWACKRCFQADSWHCEPCKVCVIGKRMPCHKCGRVSIEVGGEEQLPEWKRRMMQAEEALAFH